jgi:hypothetical protein
MKDAMKRREEAAARRKMEELHEAPRGEITSVNQPLTPSVNHSPLTADSPLHFDRSPGNDPATRIVASPKSSLKRTGSTKSTAGGNIAGCNTDNLAGLKNYDAKRAQRFQYDPHSLNFVKHFSGTIMACVLSNKLFWFNLLLYVFWLVVDEMLDSKLHCVDPAVLATPGALFVFFITGQVARAITRYNTMKSRTRGMTLHAKSAAFILSSAAGGRMDQQTMAKVRSIVTKATGSCMYFMMSIAEDRYLDVVYPEWFVSNGLIDPPLNQSDRPPPDAHFRMLHEAILELNSLAQTESDKRGVGEIIDRRTIDQAREELYNLQKDMIGLTGALADVIPQSLHNFGSVFLVFYLPIVSISIAQHKAESKKGHPEIPQGDLYFSNALGALAVCLVNFAFYGMFHLVGFFHNPFGNDTEDVPIFAMANGAHKMCTTILSYPTKSQSAQTGSPYSKS